MVGTIIISISQMSKLRLTEVKELASSHILLINKLAFKLKQSDLDLMFITTMVYCSLYMSTNEAGTAG